MINILYEPFPDSITAGGKSYPILTDFREWLRFADMIADRNLTSGEKALQCSLWLEMSPARITAEIISGLLDFLRAGELNPEPQASEEADEEEPELPKPPVFDFCIDAKYIIGDFRHFYGIDLLHIKYLHWWEFLSLLRALPDESMTMRRIGYRSTDLNEIQDKRQRARIAKIQRQIALPFEFDDEMIGAMMWNA